MEHSWMSESRQKHCVLFQGYIKFLSAHKSCVVVDLKKKKVTINLSNLAQTNVITSCRN